MSIKKIDSRTLSSLITIYQRNPNSDRLWEEVVRVFGVSTQEINSERLSSAQTHQRARVESEFIQKRKVLCTRLLRKEISFRGFEVGILNENKEVFPGAELYYTSTTPSGMLGLRTRRGKSSVIDPLKWSDFLNFFRSRI